MGRPETHEDLPTYSKAPVEVASFHLAECAELPLFLSAMLMAADMAGCMGAFITKVEHGVYRVCRDKTTEELDSALKTAQSMWDRSAEMYAHWTQDEYRVPPKHSWHLVRSYYRSMNLPPIPELETEVNS